MKKTYTKVEKNLIKKENELLKNQMAAPALKDQITEHYTTKKSNQMAKLENKASSTVEHYKKAQEQEKAVEKRNASRFNKRVADYIEAYAKDSYNASVKKVLLSEDKDVKAMKILAKAKLKDIDPKRQVATQKTKVYKTINRERKPIWEGQKLGTTLMGAIALGGMATAMAVSAMEGQPIDHEIAATVATAGIMGTAFGGGLGAVVRDTAANNKGHRLVQAYYELKTAKQAARLEAIKDVQSGEVKAEEVLNEREMKKYESIHGKVVSSEKVDTKDVNSVDINIDEKLINIDKVESDNDFDPIGE